MDDIKQPNLIASFCHNTYLKRSSVWATVCKHTSFKQNNNCVFTQNKQDNYRQYLSEHIHNCYLQLCCYKIHLNLESIHAGVPNPFISEFWRSSVLMIFRLTSHRWKNEPVVLTRFISSVFPNWMRRFYYSIVRHWKRGDTSLFSSGLPAHHARWSKFPQVAQRPDVLEVLNEEEKCVTAISKSKSCAVVLWGRRGNHTLELWLKQIKKNTEISTDAMFGHADRYFSVRQTPRSGGWCRRRCWNECITRYTAVFAHGCQLSVGS